MSEILELLKQEEHLNDLLNSDTVPDDLNDRFQQLFNTHYYQNTKNFLATTWFSGIVANVSETKEYGQYTTSFNIDEVCMFAPIGNDKFQEIGIMKNSGLLLKGTKQFPNINGHCLRNLLIDEQKQEVAFLFYDYDENNNKSNTQYLTYTYNEISFIKGSVYIYENETKTKMI